VNYTPSFTTDTPLDLYVKENLIKDTLLLMNITNKFKNDILNLKKKEIIERTLTGKKTWQNKEDKQSLI
jgi:tubulin polyglutamylase TTLL6/13